MVSRLVANSNTPTGNPGTGTRPEDDVVKLLKSIDARLANIEETSKTLDRCMDNNNHQRQICVRTGHWND